MRNLLIVLVLGMLLLGCTGTTGTPSSTGGTGGGTTTSQNVSSGGATATARITVHIKDFAFNPSDVTVKQGDTVMWVNDDTVPHQIKAAGFGSDALSDGQTYEHQFTEAPGTYDYSCAIHPSMTGTVTVTQ